MKKSFVRALCAVTALAFAVSLPLSVSANSGKNIALEGGVTPFDSGNGAYYNTGTADEKKRSNINDGDTLTGWQFDGFGNENEENKFYKENELFVGYFFDEATTIDEIDIYWEADTRAVASTKGYTVMYTKDKDVPKWEEFPDIEYEYGESEQIAIATGNVSRAQDVITFDDTEVMGIRVMIREGTSAKYYPQIFELEVYKAQSAMTTEDVSGIYHTDSEAPSEVSSEPTVIVITSTPDPTASVVPMTSGDVSSVLEPADDSGSGNMPVYVLLGIGSVLLIATIGTLFAGMKKKQ